MDIAASGFVADEPDFDKSRPSDHVAVSVMIIASWFLLLAGFIPDMLQHISDHKTYHPITHVHAFLAVSWMVLLTAQNLLVRAGQVERHMRIGRVARWLGLAVVVGAAVTAVVVDVGRLSRPTFKPQFLAFQLSHLIVFAVLTLLAFLSTNRPGAHKRLLLIATIAILDAGTSRWLGESVTAIMGEGPLAQWMLRYPLPVLLLAAIGAYDLITRRRLHPVYIPAAGLMVGAELLAIWLFFQPGFIAACGAFLRSLS